MTSHRSLASLALALLVLCACGEPEDTRPGRPVANRRAAFVAILKAFEPMGVRLRDRKYARDDFVAMAKRLDQVKDGPWRYFTPDSNYAPTHATARVWSEAQRFEAARKAFADATELLVAAAGSGNADKVAMSYELVYNTCQDCHRTFKK
jgi:cytochrome c556